MSTNVLNPFEIFAGVSIWYVRPMGGSYGSEDGTSYDDAWDGFSNIDWTASGVQPGDTLYIAGTHTEVFTVGGSGSIGNQILIRGDFGGDAGIIDAQTIRASGLTNTLHDNVTIDTLTCQNATTSCMYFEGVVGIVTNDVVCTGSGNQGLQNEAGTEAIHNNATCSNNADDGISKHAGATVVVNGGTFENNNQGIVGSDNLTVNGPITFSGNTEDIFIGGGSVNNVTSPGTIKVAATDDVTINDSTLNILSGSTLITPSVTLNNCIQIGEAVTRNSGNAASAFTFNQCLILTEIRGPVTLNKCYYKPNLASSNSWNSVFRHTLIDGAGSTDHLMDFNTGESFDIKYCVFVNIPPAPAYALLYRAGSIFTAFDNNTLVGTSNVGNGILSGVVSTMNNTIFTDLDAVDDVSTTTAYENCCFYDNTSGPNGTNNNSQTTDPLLADVGNKDYSLGVGSSCIGTGLDLGT
ncbi:hypothetical protein KAR91_85590, partial [Candidatus Pacearchaeota archaeon]|nr:hypothetical protein [Candidatus Pacearchaeota archaeon]